MTIPFTSLFFLCAVFFEAIAGVLPDLERLAMTDPLPAGRRVARKIKIESEAIGKKNERAVNSNVDFRLIVLMVVYNKLLQHNDQP